MKSTDSKVKKAVAAKNAPKSSPNILVGFWKRTTNFWKKTYNLLFHDDVYYKIGGFLIFGLILFIGSWVVFTFLYTKLGILANSFMVQKLFKSEIIKTIGPWGAGNFGSTWKIGQWTINVSTTFGVWGNVFWQTILNFLNHSVFVIIFIFFLNYFKIGRWNLGLIYFALYTIMWGIVIGTQSLPFPVGDNRIIDPLILFARFGLWVWFSYLLLIVSTTQFTWLTTPNWVDGNWEKKRKFWSVSFTPDQREVFIYGVLFLLASSFAEARIFVHYNFF